VLAYGLSKYSLMTALLLVSRKRKKERKENCQDFY
jgi:hypothetical protein